MYIFNISLIGVALLAGCGIVEPKFEDYESDATTASGPASADTECGASALSLFTENVGSVIDASCSNAGCHSSGSGAAAITLISGENDTNRSAVFTYTGLEKTKLTDYVLSANHPGKSLSSDLTEEKVTTWLTQEETCASAALGGSGGRPPHT